MNLGKLWQYHDKRLARKNSAELAQLFDVDLFDVDNFEIASVLRRLGDRSIVEVSATNAKASGMVFFVAE